jgi:hypothetical protein
MKLKCIKNSRMTEYGGESSSITYYENITPGKVYNILNYKLDNYWIIDDNGKQRGIPVECFISVEEWRDNQINQILE